MDMKVYVSCYIPSIKQTVMRIIHIHSQSTILEARDQILQALGLGERKVLLSLGLEREEYLFSGTQMYIEALHTHIDVLHLPAQHRLEPCYTLQEEFMRHEHRSPKVGDIFKLRLMLPKFNEDVQDENDLAPLENLHGRKRNLEEANCEAVIKKAKLLPTSMVSSITSLKEHLKTSEPLSRPEWMELNLPVVDVAVWVAADNRFATNDGRFAYMGRLQYKKLRQLISQLIAERNEKNGCEGVHAYDSVKSPNSYIETIGSIFIVGPVGIGKSHLLAAAVSDFTEEFQCKQLSTTRQNRVVSIIDCELLRHDQAFKVIREALFVAFGDDDKNLLRLEKCTTSDQLINFCENIEDTMLWLLDQWEAVNGDKEVKNLIFRLTCNHSMICATNSNHDLIEKANYNLSPARCFIMNEGLNDEELECWGRWKFVSSITDGEKTKELLDEMELQLLLDATGRLPVYLSAWYDALKETIQQTTRGEKMSFEVAMRALQSQRAVEIMHEYLNDLFEDAQKKSDLSRFIDGIGKYLFGSPMIKPVKDIDNQYLHIVNGHGAPSCGLVGSEIARLILKYKQHKRYFDATCLNLIKREFGPLTSEKHPLVGGAILEQTIIGVMSEQPLAFPLGNMTRLCPTLIEVEIGTEHATVEDLYMDFLKGGKEEALSIVTPLSSTYKAVDAVLVGFRRESKGCHMYISGFQISVGKLPKHRLSRKVFINRACTKWVPSSLNIDEDVSWSMNWIIPEVEIPNYHGLYIKERDSFELHSHSNIGKGKVSKEVDCLEVFTMFRQIDSRLRFLDTFKFRV